MLGKASELRSELIDARELDTWLKNSTSAIVLDIKFSMAGTSELGILPTALIIYKEGDTNETNG